MALRLKNGAEFLHIPKTGGIWVEHVLTESDLVAGPIGFRHADYDVNLFRRRINLRQCVEHPLFYLKQQLAGKSGPATRGGVPFRFCFVRHPLRWYESWWRFMTGKQWREWGRMNSTKKWSPNLILNGLGDEDFNQFIRNVVKACPGYVSQMLFSFTKPGISYIGKTESLSQDLCAVLKHLELEFDEEKILGTERKNESRMPGEGIQWDPELKALVTRLELPALIHFDYLSPQEKAELGVLNCCHPHPYLQSFAVS